MFGKIGKVFKAVGNVMNAVKGLGKALQGFMQSPFGKLLGMAFPGVGQAFGMMSMFGMFNNLAGGIGGGNNY